jgi:chemotaxis signal transduction protein
MYKPSLQREVDLMTKAHLRNVQQLAVFYTGNDEVYAINISKVKAFIIAEDTTINDTPAETDIVAGIATIREEPILIVNLDKWLGTHHENVDESEYKIIIYCEFNDVKVGFLVKEIVDIIEEVTTISEIAYMGATLPSGSAMQSFVLELILTFILMLVILGSAIHAKAIKSFAGMAIGATVGLEALFAGPICGASMNPVRSIAPAVVSGELDALWLYIIAPIIGALLAGVVYNRLLHPKRAQDEL